MDLSDFFTTKAEAVDFSTRLSTIIDKIFQTGFNLESVLSQQIGIQKKDLFLKLMRDNNVNLESHSEVKGFLEKVQQTISALPVLSLTIAFEPPEQTLKALSEWFVMNIKKQVLFEIKVDYNLIGGATITYNGKYVDYTIKPIFEKIIQDTLTHPAFNKQAPAPNEKPHISVDHFHLWRG